MNENERISLSRDAKRLWQIASEVKEYTRREMGKEFTKPMDGLGESGVYDIANFLADRVFQEEFDGIEKAKSALGDSAVRTAFKEEFLNKLKENYVTSQENSIFKYSQNTGQYVTTLSTIDQLHMVALIAGVIQSTYSIIFKTHVEKGLTFTREVDLPYVITSDGEMIDFFDLVNNGKKLLEVAGTNSPTSTVKFAVTAGKVSGNIIDEYNKVLVQQNPSTTRLTGPYDFLNRGVEIVSITENGKKIPVKYVATGYPTQSGQRSDIISSFNVTLASDETASPTKEVKILGDVRLNGDIILFVNGTTLTEIEVKFNLPAIGPRRPLQFNTRKTPIVVQIGESFSAQTTLNQNFIEKNTLVLKANLIEDFHKFSMTAVNRHKDEYAFKFIDDTIAKLEGIAATPNAVENYETTLTKNRTYAKETVEAYNANKGYVSTLVGNEDVLARAMFKVTNKLEKALNPQERKYTIYSSTAAAQWVREADGGNFNKFQELGDLGEGALAGLSLPYQLRKIRIGGHATGYFISTNARTSTSKSATFTPAGHTSAVTCDVDVHNYIMHTNYEEHLDTFAFLQGPEYIEQGTGTDQFGKNTSLNLETMFEMTAFNESLGVVEFKEDPLHF